jgi:peptidoglycan/xylan/chitin deacetylase (PgdA/CDA1 family)
VVEGEVDAPTEITLRGRYLNERRHVEYGPVRWEFHAPPASEVAELRNGHGLLLATLDFRKKTEPTPRQAQKAAPARPIPVPKTSQERSPSPLPLPSLPPPSTEAGWPGSGEGFNLLRGPKGGRRVSLTFDGGSTAEVAADILGVLAQRGVRTTFFLTGDFIHRYPDLVRRMDREGHEIGNHTLSHPHLAPNGRRDPRWTKERFQKELLDADATLMHLLGRPMDPYWRAPYGEQTAELRRWAEEIGYRHIGWSEGADTLDWATRSDRKLYRTGDAILDRLYSRMERQDGDGLIVLMHLGSGRPESDRPARVLGPFMDQALRDGWTFVSVGHYLHASGKPQWNRANRAALLSGR